jgi:hypothetical protein
MRTSSCFSVRPRLSGLVAAFCLSILAATAYSRGAGDRTAVPVSVKIVADGQAEAVLVVPDADDSTGADRTQPPWIEFKGHSHWKSSSRASAEILAHYLHLSTKAKFDIYRESEVPAGRTQIHVGPTKFAQELRLLEGLKDSSGFVICAVRPDRAILLGGSPLGTEYAVYEFLERFVGVRWLYPGKDWECVPGLDSLAVDGKVTQEPAFTSRLFRWQDSDEGTEWTRRSRIHSRIEFHHNISKLVDIAYTKSNPEYFPLIEGERRLPTRINQSNWHPCFTTNGLADALGEKLVKFFDENPGYESVSLGVSDGDGESYCHGPKCEKAREGKINAFGFDNNSDQYYRWVDRIASRVAMSHPEKILGTLAYRELIDPPQEVAVPDNVVPYFTWESLQWVDARRRKEFISRFEPWSQRVKHMGVYDYVWLGAYEIPLIYPEILAEYLEFVREHKTIGYYAETRLRGIESGLLSAPMVYALTRLIWNPGLNTRDLMGDWCEKAVGSQAAGFLVEYYEIWNTFWSTRVQKTPWFGSSNSLYLMFNQNGYLAGVRPEDINRSLELLDKAVASAGTEAEIKRAKLLREQFAKRVPILRYQSAIAAMTSREVEPIESDAAVPVFEKHFTDGPEGWVSRKEIQGLPWDPDQGNEQPGSLKIKAWKKGLGDNATASTLALWQVKLGGGKNYLLEYTAKSENLPANAIVTLALCWRDEVKDEKKLMPYKALIVLPKEKMEGSEWQTTRIAFSTPDLPEEESARYFDAWLSTKNLQNGQIWIDDLKVLELPND